MAAVELAAENKDDQKASRPGRRTTLDVFAHLGWSLGMPGTVTQGGDQRFRVFAL